MRRVLLSIFVALLLVFLTLPGMAEGTQGSEVIIGPGGENPESNDPGIIIGPGGISPEYDEPDDPGIIIGPGGISPEYDEPDDPGIIVGPGGISPEYDNPGIIDPVIHVYMYVKTNGGHLNVRAWADSSATIIGRLAYGDQVLVTGYPTNSSWARIAYGNQDAYVQKRYLSETEPYPIPTPTPYYPPYPTNPPYPTTPPYYPTTPPYYPTTPPYYPETTISDLNAVFDTMVTEIKDPITVTTHPVRNGELVPLYWAPDQDSSVMRYCYEGESFSVTAYNEDWVQVRDDAFGYTGYLIRAMAY